jgi:hypothetical protein
MGNHIANEWFGQADQERYFTQYFLKPTGQREGSPV